MTGMEPNHSEATYCCIVSKVSDVLILLPPSIGAQDHARATTRTTWPDSNRAFIAWPGNMAFIAWAEERLRATAYASETQSKTVDYLVDRLESAGGRFLVTTTESAAATWQLAVREQAMFYVRHIVRLVVAKQHQREEKNNMQSNNIRNAPCPVHPDAHILLSSTTELPAFYSTPIFSMSLNRLRKATRSGDLQKNGEEIAPLSEESIPFRFSSPHSQKPPLEESVLLPQRPASQSLDVLNGGKGRKLKLNQKHKGNGVKKAALCARDPKGFPFWRCPVTSRFLNTKSEKKMDIRTRVVAIPLLPKGVTQRASRKWVRVFDCMFTLRLFTRLC
jgi:hypothetical protein